MIVGAHSWASRLPPRQHTSAFYLAADGTLLGRYDKLYLIPWSEYVPFECPHVGVHRRAEHPFARDVEQEFGAVPRGPTGEVRARRLEADRDREANRAGGGGTAVLDREQREVVPGKAPAHIAEQRLRQGGAEARQPALERDILGPGNQIQLVVPPEECPVGGEVERRGVLPGRQP